MERNNINIKKCKSQDYTVQFAINILVHISFLILILTSVFSFYTESIMTDSVNNQVNNLINDNFDKYFDNNIKEGEQNAIDNTKVFLKLFNIDPKKYTQILKNLFKTNNDRNNNNSLMKKTLYIFSGMLIFTVLVSFYVSKALCSKIDLGDILLENFIIFFFVGIIELLFFKFIILKYIPAYPSDVKNILLEELKKY
jgi:hypothetical protein